MARKNQISVVETVLPSNPMDDIFDPQTGERWLPILGVDGTATPAYFMTETGLESVRMLCRWLHSENVFAINAVGNMISYVVGPGVKFTVSSKSDVDPLSQGEVEDLQDWLDDWIEESDFECDEEEIVRRCERDGEAIVRSFPGGLGMEPSVRFVEPRDLRQPANRQDATMGILTAPNDVRTPLIYFVNGEPVPATEITHFKLNVDGNVKRGMPTLWAMRRHLYRAERILSSSSVMAQYLASIAAVRYHETSSGEAVRKFADRQADFEFESPRTGNTRRGTSVKNARIMDVPAGIKMEFPTANVDPSGFIEVVNAELRAAASAVNFPEYMLTANAQNNNLSSGIVAESPAHKMFRRRQKFYGTGMRNIVWKTMLAAAARGELDPELLVRAEIKASMPKIETRDELREAQANDILHSNRVKSAKTWQKELGLDVDDEEENFRKEDENVVGSALPPAPPVPDPKGDPNSSDS